MKVSIAEIVDDFPSYRVAVVVARDLSVPSERPARLDAGLKEVEDAVRSAWNGRQLSEIPAIADWRGAYKSFGIRKTSYRSSVERLVKNLMADQPLPRINALVDLYNAVSAMHVVPIGADDLDHVAGDIAFRYARPGDSFIRLGDAAGEEDPPKAGEVVYADGEKVLCRRWNWSQDARSAITPATTRAVITVQDLGTGEIDAAVGLLADWIGEFCDGRAEHVVLDAGAPVAGLP